MFASLKLDSVGNPHMAYYNQNSGYLEYVFKNNGTWNYTNITTYRGNAGWFPSLVLDSNDNPCISFYNAGAGKCKIEYAFKSGDNWTIENIDSNFTHQYSSLALDTDNNPYISYFDHNNSILKFVHRVNGTWNVEIVENNSNPDNYIIQFLDGPSLTLDAESNPNIAYSDRSTGFLKFAHRVNGTWNVETVDNGLYSALYISLALCHDGNPGISYCDFNSSNGSIYSGFLKYASKTNGIWSTKILDNNLIDGLSTSLAFKDGNPCISYCYYNLNFTEGKLKYIQFVPDITSPSIISVDPLNNSLININKEIKIIFSEDIFAGSAWDDINIFGPHGIFLMNKSIVGNVLILIPEANYSDGNYTVNIPSNALNDLAGNVLLSNCVSGFSIDKTLPMAWASLKSGLYNSNMMVYLIMSEPGAIYYTINGSNPTNSSLKYFGQINISSTTTLKFMAVDESGNPSQVYTATYKIDKVAPKVVLTYPKHVTTNFSRTSTIYVKLSENLKSSVNWSKIYIKNLKTGKLVKIIVSISGNVIKISMALKRSSYTWYSVYIPAAAVKDYAGNNLANTCSFRFKTGK